MQATAAYEVATHTHFPSPTGQKAAPDPRASLKGHTLGMALIKERQVSQPYPILSKPVHEDASPWGTGSPSRKPTTTFHQNLFTIGTQGA